MTSTGGRTFTLQPVPPDAGRATLWRLLHLAQEAADLWHSIGRHDQAALFDAKVRTIRRMLFPAKATDPQPNCEATHHGEDESRAAREDGAEPATPTAAAAERGGPAAGR